MKTNNFTQLNLVAVLERANQILEAAAILDSNPKVQREIIAHTSANYGEMEPGDMWEAASLRLAALEITERCIRAEDPSVESAPAGYAGGFGSVTTPNGGDKFPRAVGEIADKYPKHSGAKEFVQPPGPTNEEVVEQLKEAKIAVGRLHPNVQEVLIYLVKRHSPQANLPDREAINDLGSWTVQDCVHAWVGETRSDGSGMGQVSTGDIADGVFNILAASLA